jgi:hypothetical protein
MCIRFDDAPAPGTGKLRWLLTPKALRFLASLRCEIGRSCRILMPK